MADKTGICKLCNEMREIRYSHFIPEFLYLGIYNEKHKGLMFSNSPDSQRRKEIQKGYREYLLCDSCENQFSKYEFFVFVLRSDESERSISRSFSSS